MEKLKIEGTATTPDVNFDPLTGEMIIMGRSIPEQAKAFWSPVLSWFFAYSAAPAFKTKVIIDMEFFNNASAKQLMFMFSRINEIYESGYSINVEWYFDKNDLEMKESGLDFASLLSFDIQIKEKSEGLAIAG